MRFELSEGDLWESLSNGEAFDGSKKKDLGDTPFSEEEQHVLQEVLDRFLSEVRSSYEIPSQDFERLQEEIGFLKEEVGRQSRNAWVRMLLGALMASILDSETLFGIARNLFLDLHDLLSEIPELGPQLAPYLLLP